jgi:hypothetical protein
VEVVLRALAQGEVSGDRQALALLRVGGFVAEPTDEVFTITELGEMYLNARSDLRFPACLEVLAVDKTARLAQVVVGAWDTTRPVPVLLDQLTDATGLAAEELPGVWLDAEANCHAQEPDDVVLTRIRVAGPLPAGFMDGESGTAVRALAPAGGEQA